MGNSNSHSGFQHPTQTYTVTTPVVEAPKLTSSVIQVPQVTTPVTVEAPQVVESSVIATSVPESPKAPRSPKRQAKGGRSPRRRNLQDYTLPELRSLAKERGYYGYSKLRKDELIALLRK